MIKKLSLKNYKTHKDTELEFSPGINIITGDTGQGKTNILLALKWIVEDRPRGEGCIRRGQDGSTAVMEVVDNKDTCSIIRRRNKSENIYKIEKDGLDIDPFETNFPPNEVLDILNLSDINIQKQRDPYFLVYAPPGKVTTYIRSITKLDEIDKVTKVLSSKIRSEKSEISYREGELESTNKKLVILNEIDLASLEDKIVRAKDCVLRIEQIGKKVERIRSIISELKILESHRIILPDNLDQIFSKAEECSEFMIEVSKQVLKFKVLLDRIKEIRIHKIILPENLDQIFGETKRYSESIVEASERISRLKVLLDKINEIRIHKIILPENFEILSSIESTLSAHGNIYKKIDSTLGLLEEVNNIKLKISDTGHQLERLESEEKHLMGELDVCPSCGVELTNESKKHLLGGIE